MDSTIRKARPDEAEEISALIRTTLKQSNAQDYPDKVIAFLVTNFSPDHVRRYIKERYVLVAEKDRHIVATASLNEDFVRSLFVLPQYQGRGYGRDLLMQIIDLARNEGVETLLLRSSITAEKFYKKLGFSVLKDEWHEDMRSILMQYPLRANQQG